MAVLRSSQWGRQFSFFAISATKRLKSKQKSSSNRFRFPAEFLPILITSKRGYITSKRGYNVDMLESIFGNATVEKVLLYLQNYNEGYASEIATTFSISLSVVQKQLKRLEDGGIIVSQPKGRTRLFLWNPRYPFREELQTLLEKSFEFMPENEIKKYYRKRQRPRRGGKPL